MVNLLVTIFQIICLAVHVNIIFLLSNSRFLIYFLASPPALGTQFWSTVDGEGIEELDKAGNCMNCYTQINSKIRANRLAVGRYEWG